jgi:AraC-like DNA-binding protein
MVLWLTAESTLWLLRDSERSFAALISFSEDQIREQTGAADMLLTSDVVLRRALPRSHARSLLPVLRDIAAQRAEVADSGLRYLLARLWEQAGIDQTHLRQSTINPIVQRAVRALEQDPTLGATELAHLAGMSYKHLARLFKVELGEGPTQVRQKIRIDRFMVEYSASKNLLESALAAGFGSYPQFYRVFRRHTGLNPRAYFRSGRSCLSELPAGGPSAGIVSGLGTSTPEA